MIETFSENEMKYYVLKNDTLGLILRVNSEVLELVHFGRPLGKEDALFMSVIPGTGYGTSTIHNGICADILPLAWSESGIGDLRESPVEVQVNGKPVILNLKFDSAQICSEQEKGALPRAHGFAERLLVTYISEVAQVNLWFELFDTALVRRTEIINLSGEDITVTKLMSNLLDLKGRFEMTTFDGTWNGETHAHTVKVLNSKVVNESVTGFSSQRHNPGFVLSDGNEVYGFNLIYSGNHYASAQKSVQNFTRVLQGMNFDHFACTLKSGEKLESPEAVIAYSPNGLNGMRKNMHAFVMNHVVPTYWKEKERPVLYNDWEGCMFDFTESKLLSLAKKAKTLGTELFVLDDGWFGARNSDKAGLGDYNVNLKKLPGGITGLADKIRSMGMEFGLWFEPEAVNPDSDLYRAHPDWALEGDLSRNELLLDLRKPEVRDYIVENVSRVVDEAKVSYVKWDMNRHSPLLGYDAHEYILGLYEVLDRIFTPRPEVLLEGCASGGNRFDLGILTFAPQIWGSDDTDPIERLDIKGGLFALYPQSTVGCHVSACAHSQTLRQTPLSTRANMSMFGAFGIEFDVTKTVPTDEDEIKNAVAFYKAHRKTFQFGTLSVCKTEEDSVAWQVTSADGNEAIAGVFHRLVHAAQGYEWLYADTENLSDGTYAVTTREQLLRVGQFANLLGNIMPISLNPNGLIVHEVDKHYRMKDGVFTAKVTKEALAAGIPLNQKFLGTGYDPNMRNQGDFGSNVYLIHKEEQ